MRPLAPRALSDGLGGQARQFAVLPAYAKAAARMSKLPGPSRLLYTPMRGVMALQCLKGIFSTLKPEVHALNPFGSCWLKEPLTLLEHSL